jgi:hypothetical protein
MLKQLIDNIKNIDKKVFKIMIFGFKCSFIVCFLSSIISLSYILNPISHILFDSGIILFKTGLTFASAFFVCAFAMDKIKKQLEV